MFATLNCGKKYWSMAVKRNDATSRRIIAAFEAGKPIDDAILKAVRKAVPAKKRARPVKSR